MYRAVALVIAHSCWFVAGMVAAHDLKIARSAPTGIGKKSAADGAALFKDIIGGDPRAAETALRSLTRHALGRDRARRLQAIDLLRVLRGRTLPDDLAISVEATLIIVEQCERDRGSEAGVERSALGEIEKANLTCSETPLRFFARRPESLRTLKAMSIQSLFDEEDLEILQH